MKSINELKKAIEDKVQLVWDDPNPIPNNDYTITHIEELTKDIDKYSGILIQYGDGSEAEVYMSEIIYKQSITNQINQNK